MLGRPTGLLAELIDEVLQLRKGLTALRVALREGDTFIRDKPVPSHLRLCEASNYAA